MIYVHARGMEDSQSDDVMSNGSDGTGQNSERPTPKTNATSLDPSHSKSCKMFSVARCSTGGCDDRSLELELLEMVECMHIMVTFGVFYDLPKKINVLFTSVTEGSVQVSDYLDELEVAGKVKKLSKCFKEFHQRNAEGDIKLSKPEQMKLLDSAFGKLLSDNTVAQYLRVRTIILHIYGYPNRSGTISNLHVHV